MKKGDENFSFENSNYLHKMFGYFISEYNRSLRKDNVILYRYYKSFNKVKIDKTLFLSNYITDLVIEQSLYNNKYLKI